MIGILIPLLLLIPNPVRAWEVERQQPYPGMLPESASAANEMIQRFREWESQEKRKDPEFDINNALADYWNNGSNDPTEPEVLLQLPRDQD
jgi:hypothetical protein